MSTQGECLPRGGGGGGGCLPGGVSAQGVSARLCLPRGVCLPRGGVSAQRGSVCPGECLPGGGGGVSA